MSTLQLFSVHALLKCSHHHITDRPSYTAVDCQRLSISGRPVPPVQSARISMLRHVTSSSSFLQQSSEELRFPTFSVK